ncbi:MAG: T9SS type A sorting domain-containing protein [Rhodothermales bacterium]|nr:T9SS type A sorting domain-containing protein [Rhodothermales bacterium]
MLRFATPFAFLLLFAAAALAQPKPVPRSSLSGGDPDGCQLGNATADLYAGDVYARLYNHGGLFWNGGNPTYVVPAETGVTPLFTAGVWIGGMVNGELRIAAARYDNYEFWPGPLDEGEPPEDCEPYDRIWTVSAFDVQDYEETGEASPDLAEWPVDLGAPWTDANGDGEYDLEDGDRPVVYGHQTAFWVMNDAANEHEETGAPPLHVEVRVTAFAVASETEALDQATFYRYEMHYEGEAPLEDARFGVWSDPDVGTEYTDDYSGSDPDRGLGFAYNADDTDLGGYEVPPAVGFDLLSGADSFVQFRNSAGATGDPSEAAEYWNYLNARWADGEPITFGGNGRGGDTPTDWVFPGSVYPEPEYWSEFCLDPACTESNTPDNLKGVIVAPTFSMEPGEVRTFDVAILFGQGESHLQSVQVLKQASDEVQALYDGGDLFAPGPPLSGEPLPTPQLLSPADGAFVDELPLVLDWAPVPEADFYRVELAFSPDFAEAETYIRYGDDTEIDFGAYGNPNPIPLNEEGTVYWRVRAFGGLRSSDPAEASFDFYVNQPAWAGEGAGLIEVAHPAGDPCGASAESTDGCDEYGGNTVWLSPNSTGSYFLTVNGGDNPETAIFDRFSRYVEAAAPDDFEIRFTADCVDATPCYALAGFTDGTVYAVPFEIWNVGETPDDPADDTRTIPFVFPNGKEDGTFDWDSQTEFYLDAPASDAVYAMAPDLEAGGYAAFAAASAAVGVGNAPAGGAFADGVENANPAVPGEPCPNQGNYVLYCYRNDQLTGLYPGGLPGASFVYPIGRLLFADLDEDGAGPPVGTVMRLLTEGEPNAVDAEGDGPVAAADAAALLPPYPNPSRASAEVAFRLSRPERVRVAVLDVLGREVARLVDGPRLAGAHRARLDASGLAAGVYLVVLEAEGVRAVRKLLLLK